MDEKAFNWRPFEYKSTDLAYKLLYWGYKKRWKATGWVAAPPTKWRLTWKHSGIMHRAPMDQIQIHWPGIQITVGRLQKAVKTHWVGCSTTNKMEADLETLRDHA
jgi:hypothetical protein